MRKDIDFVYVATPISTRARFVRTALKYGKKVLCEEPVLDLPVLNTIAMEQRELFTIAYHRRHI